MSSDPLPLPEIWSDLPDGTADAGARSELAVNGHSGLVLIEYASGYAQPDPQPFARPLDCVEQPAAKERLPSLVPAALAKGLADLAAIVTQAEALLRAQGTLKADVHFAVERIHDVAMALRMRDVDSALCDTLEASVREVGDAVVRHEAAATGALSAAALLRDVMRRLEDLTVVALRAAAVDVEPLVPPSATEAAAEIEVPPVTETAIEAVGQSAAETWRTEEAQPQVSSAGPEAEAVDRAQPADPPVARLADGLIVDDEQARSSLETVSDNESTEDAAAERQLIVASPAAALRDEVAERGESQTIASANSELVKPVGLPAIAAAKEEVAGPADSAAVAAPNDEAFESIESIAIAATTDEVNQPAESITAPPPHRQQESNVAPAANEPQGESVSAAIAAETAVPVVTETRSEQEPTQRASLHSAGQSGIAAPTKRDRPANDPLAALYGLSEEELIALFC